MSCSSQQPRREKDQPCCALHQRGGETHEEEEEITGTEKCIVDDMVETLLFAATNEVGKEKGLHAPQHSDNKHGSVGTCARMHWP